MTYFIIHMYCVVLVTLFFINDCLFFCPLHCPSHTVRDATAGCHGVCDHLSYFICPAGSTVVITVVEVLEC